MNKASDCDGKPREVYQDTVYIFGKTSETLQSRVLSCTVTLTSSNEREPNRFKIQFLAVNIRDPNVQLTIYDGEFDGRQLVCISIRFKLGQYSLQVFHHFYNGQL